METVAGSPAFARPFARRRCLVPADGWYEWLVRDGAKRAYVMTRRDGARLAFAGVWSARGTGAARIRTVSMLTLPAVGELTRVHHRTPLPNRWQDWLGAADATGLLAAPAPQHAAGIGIRPVESMVGDVRRNGPTGFGR